MTQSIDDLYDLLEEEHDKKRALEARVQVLEARCDRLFEVATALRDEAVTCHDGISAHINFETWETFTHDLAVLWRARTGERVVMDAGIYLDG